MEREYLRKATKTDCMLLYEWRNDDLVRKNSFSQEEISFEEHKKWFYNKLDSNLCDIYLYYLENEPIGQIRLDYKDDIAIISYSISSGFRNHGYGRKILELIEEEAWKQETIKYLYGEVKKENLASLKKFQQLGYKMYDGDIVKFYKELVRNEKNKGGGILCN